jgi:hypothetical protein
MESQNDNTVNNPKRNIDVERSSILELDFY